MCERECVQLCAHMCVYVSSRVCECVWNIGWGDEKREAWVGAAGEVLDGGGGGGGTYFTSRWRVFLSGPCDI